MPRLDIHIRRSDDRDPLRAVTFGGFHDRAVELSLMTTGCVAIFGAFGVWVFALLWQ